MFGAEISSVTLSKLILRMQRAKWPWSRLGVQKWFCRHSSANYYVPKLLCLLYQAMCSYPKWLWLTLCVICINCFERQEGIRSLAFNDVLQITPLSQIFPFRYTTSICHPWWLLESASAITWKSSTPTLPTSLKVLWPDKTLTKARALHSLAELTNPNWDIHVDPVLELRTYPKNASTGNRRLQIECNVSCIVKGSLVWEEGIHLM